MKKCLKVFLLLAVLTLCIACKKEEKIEPIDLKDEYYAESKFEEVDLDGLKKLIDDKETFVVYVYLPGCSSCAAFKEVLDEFQKDNNLFIYSTQIEYAKQTEIGDKITYAPSFVVFKEGKIYGYLRSEKDEDLPYYETAAKFKEWLIKYVNLKTTS